LGGLNASGQVKISFQSLPDLTLTLSPTLQVPQVIGSRELIDADTPQELWTISSFHDPSQELQLIFSDEFNLPNRTFYPGDDPYFEAVDLHYWATGNLEWYDPKAVITKDGALEIALTKEKNHDLNYTGGMLSSWNKFCFTGGLIVANVSLPGPSNVAGLWPAIWTLGNLGRAGYGASLEGLVRISVLVLIDAMDI
jgi:beta-glucanase (GH16 family)